MDAIRELRNAAEAARISVSELASRSGVSRATAYRIFDGTTSPRLDDLHELFLATGVDFRVVTTPVHDLDAAAAARVILGDLVSSATPSITAWVERLARVGHGDPAITVRTAGQVASVLHDPDAVALRADDWDVDRLVSAGRASQKPWALSGWAALNAMGEDVDAPTLFWAEDTRLVRQLLADSMTLTSLDDADVILSRGNAQIFAHAVDIEAVILVDTLQALIDCIGLGGSAESVALTRIENAR